MENLQLNKGITENYPNTSRMIFFTFPGKEKWLAMALSKPKIVYWKTILKKHKTNKFYIQE